MTTHINGKSEKEREGRRDEDRTVSFLLLPIVFLILGGDSAVECRVFHRENGVDEY